MGFLEIFDVYNEDLILSIHSNTTNALLLLSDCWIFQDEKTGIFFCTYTLGHVFPLFQHDVMVTSFVSRLDNKVCG